MAAYKDIGVVMARCVASDDRDRFARWVRINFPSDAQAAILRAYDEAATDV